MGKILILTILLFLSQNLCFSQAEKTNLIGKPRVERVDEKLYNKQTGKKMTGEDLALLLKENPGLQLIPEFNRYGEVERYLYDPENPFYDRKRDPSKSPKSGEMFPEFTFTTTKNKTLPIEELMGSWILIQFQTFPEMTNEKQLKQLNEEIQNLKNQGVRISSFIVFSYDDDIDFLIEEYQDSFHFVKNGIGFNEMFHISNFPSTFLINPQGIITNLFLGFDEIKIIPHITSKPN
jgi:peroxiredoxin